MPTVYKHVEIEVGLDEFSDNELIEELESRVGKEFSFTEYSLVSAIYEKRRLNQEYQPELDELIYTVIGKIV